MGDGPSGANAMIRLGNLASQQPNEIRERNTAAEETYGGLLADIGNMPVGTPASQNPNAPSAAPSAPPADHPDDLLTRDNVTFTDKKDAKKYDKLIKKGYSKEQAMGFLPGSKDISQGDSIFTTGKTEADGMGVGGKLAPGTTTKLDPNKAKAQMESSSAFRQINQMTAESEQMLNRSGPLYDEMNRSMQLPIIEGAAASARENTENIRAAMQRGGAARTAAFAAVQKIRSQEQINMMKGQALSQAHMNLDMWARDNAKNVINFGMNWASNQAGIRQSFNKAMDHASDLMANSSLPFMFTTKTKEMEYRQQASAQRRSNVQKWVNYGLGIVAAVATYGQNTGLLEQANTQISGGNNKVSSENYGIPSSMVGQTANPDGSAGTASEDRTLGGDLKGAARSVGNAASSAYGYMTGGF
jgi:hypothetical protein